MYRFFQRNQKKLLAIFGAFLMVVFILPGSLGSGRGRRQDPVVGYLGKEKIHMVEMAQARQDWDLLKRIPFRVSRFQQVPWVQYKLGPLATEIQKTPELFLLLQKEAERRGMRVSPERVDGLLHAELEGSPSAPPEDVDRRRHAAESFLLVESLYDRVGDNVKVSEPMVDRHLAMVAQEVKLNLVEFRSDDFKSATTAPTTQEIQEQFRKYANVPASQPTTAPASLPFGYQYPDRVKLQYLVVKKDQVRDAVKKTKSDYDWDVAAHRYYLTHPLEFQVTKPAASPLGPALPSAASAPTTQPFEEVKTQVLEKVMQPDVERLTGDIRAAISRRLAAAWEEQRGQAAGGASSRPSSGPASGPTAGAATGPATGPASAPAATQPAGYASFAFLEQLAADIQKQFGVLPSVTSKSDQWLTADDLSKLPGIGLAHTRGDDGRNFANYVLTSAEPFFPVPAKADASAVLKVLQPSQPLEDFDGNVYFFRLTDAQAAHAPTDVAEVRDKVATDVVTAREYARAVDEAKKLLEAAKKQTLEAAAAAAGRVVKSTGNISRRFGPTTIPNYPLESEARSTLVTQAYTKLLAEASPDHPHPMAVIELPSEHKVVVAELAAVTSQLQPDQAFADRLYVARQMAAAQQRELAADWFKADAVKSRLAYRSTTPDDDKRKADEDRKKSDADDQPVPLI